MKTSLIFLDTSFFKGLVDPKDEFHKQSASLWEKLLSEQVGFLTTNFILDESFTLIRKRCGEELVREFKEVVGLTRRLKVERVRLEDENKVWDWFWVNWSSLSYTDCTSFAVMKRLGIERVATFDEHFSRAGFKVVR